MADDWDMEDAPAPAPVAAEAERDEEWDEDPPDAPPPPPSAAHDAMVEDTFSNAPPPPPDEPNNDAGSYARPDVVMQSVDELVASYAANAASSAAQDTGCANLFIGNLSWRVDEPSLRHEFEPFGIVTAVRVMSDEDTGKSKGYGYVEFANFADAAKAMAEKNGADVNGRNIRIDFATARDRPERSGRGGGGGYGGGGYGGGAAKNPESDTLFVGGLPYSADEGMLRDAFAAHGTVIEVRIPTDRDTGATKGFAYVNFSSIDEARTTFEQMNGADLGGRSLRLDYAKARTGGGGGGGGGAGGRGGDRPPNPPGVKLFVGNFSDEGTEEMLRDTFGVHGEITDVYVPTDSDTGATRGFAYLSFSTVDEAMAASEALNGTEFGGRNLCLDYAEVKERPARAPRPVEEPTKEPSVKLFVGGLPDQATEDVLREAFGVHGTITDIYLPTDQDTGNPRGFAYLSFSSIEEAMAAVEALNGSELAGRQLRLDYAEVRERPAREPRPVEEPKNEPAAKLFVGGVSDQATEEVLRETFGVHGEITDLYIPTDGDTGAPRGFAYLTFSSVEAAMAAIEALNGQEMAGRQLRLDYAEVRERAARPVEDPKNEPAPKLFIGGLSDEVATEEVLRENFGAHGQITDLYIPTDGDTGNPRGFAYLTFSSIEEAMAAVEALNGKEMAGSQLRLDYAEVRERAPREPRPIEDPTNDPTSKLFVGGISAEATDDVIREAFGVHGELTDLYIPTDAESGEPRGFAYVSYANVEMAIAAAAALNGQELAGRQLRIDFAEIKERAPREPRETTDPTSPPSNTLYVGGLSRDASEVIVRASFIIHAQVTGVRFLPPDAETGEARGFCYVSFTSVEEAMKAVAAMNGAEISGRQINLDYASESAGGPLPPRIPDVAHAFDPNEGITARAREFNTHIAAEINVPDRFELFLLQDGEKKITEQIDTRTPNSSIFTILKEDHTLCNLLRAHLLKDPAVLFAGYKIPHPLFAKVELRVQTDGSITPKEAVISCSKKLVSDLGQFSREFTKEFELRKMVANASAGPQLQNGQM